MVPFPSGLRRPALFLGLIVLLSAAGIVWGWPAYRRWANDRAVDTARTAIAEGDAAEAAKHLRHVLRQDRQHLAALQLMAELASTLGSASAIDWREQSVKARTNAFQARLDLAATALQFRDFSRAHETLTGFSAQETNTAAFQQTAGALALATNQVERARQHFALAVQFEPTNRLALLNLAVVESGSTNRELRAAGLNQLETLSRSTDVGEEALRALMGAAVRQGDLPEARRYSSELLLRPRHNYDDQLAQLRLLGSKAGAWELLPKMQKAASTVPTRIPPLVSWMNEHGPASDTLAWLERLPVRIKETPSVSMAIADTYLVSTNWTALLHTLARARWQQMDPLRHAVMARAHEQLNDTNSMAAEWKVAVERGGQPEVLGALERLARKWGWTNASHSLLWTIYHRAPHETWPLTILYRDALAAHQTAEIHRALSAMLDAGQQAVWVKNNLAIVSFLLLRGTERGHRLAEEAFAQAPDSPAALSTLGYSLTMRGRGSQSLALYARASPEVLRRPEVAGYYALTLLAVGDRAHAREYLDLAFSDSFLPEEKALFENARKSLR